MHNLLQNFQEHSKHYLVQFLILIAGLLISFVYSHDKELRALILMLTTIGYTIFGLNYYYSKQELNHKIIIEYLSFSVLGILMIYSLLLWN